MNVDMPDARRSGARFALVLLLAINLFNYIDRQVLSAVLDWISAAPGMFAPHSRVARFMSGFQRAFGFAPKMALLGLLSTAFMVVYMFAAPVFGRLAERGRRWRLIGIGVVLWSIASGMSGAAASFGALLLTRCFVGFGEAAYGPIAPAMISDYFPVRVRGQVMAWFYAAIPVGSALGYVLGGVLAHSALGWRWAFYLAAGPGALLGLWCFRMREPQERAQHSMRAERPGAVPWRDYLVLARTPSYLLCTLGMIAMTFSIGGIAVWMPFYLERLGHQPGLTRDPTAVFGLLIAVSGLVGTLMGGLAGDLLRRRFSGSYFLVSGLAMLTGLPLFVAFFYVPFPFAWGLLFLACFCVFFNTGPTNTILANVTSPAIRAGAFALNILLVHLLGDAISPLIIGLVSDRYTLKSAFLMMSSLFIVSGVCWLGGARFLQGDMRERESL